MSRSVRMWSTCEPARQGKERVSDSHETVSSSPKQTHLSETMKQRLAHLFQSHHLIRRAFPRQINRPVPSLSNLRQNCKVLGLGPRPPFAKHFAFFFEEKFPTSLVFGAGWGDPTLLHLFFEAGGAGFAVSEESVEVHVMVVHVFEREVRGGGGDMGHVSSTTRLNFTVP